MKRFLTGAIILAALLGLWWMGSRPETPNAPPEQVTEQAQPPAEPTPVPTPEPTLPTDGQTLEVHFIDVGQGDATLFLCNGHAMLVDGGTPENSDRIYSVLKTLGISQLDYIVCTHPHEDHVGGLAGALNACTAGAIWSPVATYDSDAFRAFAKYASAQGKTLEMPSLDAAYPLGGATVTVLGPRTSYEEPNNQSLVLKVTFGETSFLLTGDAEEQAEHALIDADVDLSATVYQVGHHGSDTSTGYQFLREIMP